MKNRKIRTQSSNVLIGKYNYNGGFFPPFFHANDCAYENIFSTEKSTIFGVFYTKKLFTKMAAECKIWSVHFRMNNPEKN